MRPRTSSEVMDSEYLAALKPSRAKRRAPVKPQRRDTGRNRRQWQQVALFLADREVNP